MNNNNDELQNFNNLYDEVNRIIKENKDNNEIKKKNKYRKI